MGVFAYGVRETGALRNGPRTAEPAGLGRSWVLQDLVAIAAVARSSGTSFS
ncbi:hypothetical protein FB388_3982 [Pseudonocardia cypriaca]|uniref:Uncharacterized protein n=1 Tax=Pseudonocardia cypriaca TaxID=882449 RepID=A0A543FSI9_9PSEU|nr:hypothetical protein FB388_3982 [Pseudonocardia cypriaca]